MTTTFHLTATRPSVRHSYGASSYDGAPIDQFALTGKRIVLTGSAGRLGKVWCEYLTARGAEVIGLDIAGPSPVDITDADAIEEALADIVPDGLICAAAIDAKPGTSAALAFEQQTDVEWEDIASVNLTAVATCCRIIGGRMAASGRGGSILLVSSIYGVVGPDQRRYDPPFVKPAAYTATKAALLGLTRWLATYWGASNVRTNAIVFGALADANHPEGFRDSMKAAIPLGRLASEEEWCGVLHLLLSDAGRYMTGSTVTVDGGYTAW